MKLSVLFLSIIFFSVQMNAQNSKEYAEYIDNLLKKVENPFKELHKCSFKNIYNKKLDFSKFKEKYIQFHLLENINDSILNVCKEKETLNKTLTDSTGLLHFLIISNVDKKSIAKWKDKLNTFVSYHQIILASDDKYNSNFTNKIVSIIDYYQSSFTIKIDRNGVNQWLDMVNDHSFEKQKFTIEIKFESNKDKKRKLKSYLEGIKVGYYQCIFFRNFSKINLKDNQGNIQKLEKFKGKYVRLHFWATWCGNCIKQFQRESEYEKNTAQDLNIVNVTICVKDKKENWENFLKEKSYLNHYLNFVADKDFNPDLARYFEKEEMINILPVVFYLKIKEDGTSDIIHYIEDRVFEIRRMESYEEYKF